MPPPIDSIKKFKRSQVVILVGVVVFLIALFMPTPEGMTPSGQRLLAVVLLMGIWWMGEGTAISATALMPLVLFPVLDIMSSKEVAAKYVNHLIFLFLGGFMIAIAMERWNFHKRLALQIILRVGTRPERIVLGFMVATAFLSMWISNTATTMMMLPVAMAVVGQVAQEASLKGEQNTETEAAIRQGLGLVLMLGLAYSASIGGVGTLIGTPPNIVFAGFYKQLHPELPEVTFFQWMTFAVPVIILFLPLVWLYLCRVVSPVPLGEIEIKNGGNLIQNELRALGNLNRAEKIIAGVFVTTAFLWIFRKPIVLGPFTVPGWSSLFPRPEYLHDATVAMTMGLFLLLFPLNGTKGMDLKGKREFFILDWRTVQEKVPWGILLLFGGGFALAAGFGKTGLDSWVGNQLAGVQDLPLVWVVLLLCLGMTFLTELTSNTATTTMILPIIAATAVAAEIHPLLLMVPVTLSASFAFMLPIATPPNAIVYSSGWVTVQKMSRAGLVLNFLGAFFITALVFLIVQRMI